MTESSTVSPDGAVSVHLWMGVTEAPSERHASLSASSGTWRKSAHASFAFSSSIAAVGGAVPTDAWHLERSDTTPAVAATGSATNAPAPTLSVAVSSVIGLACVPKLTQVAPQVWRGKLHVNGWCEVERDPESRKSLGRKNAAPA